MDEKFLPTQDEAVQYAIMINAGLPAEDAIRYFTDSEDPAEVATLLRKWQRSAAVRRAMHQLMGKTWQEMTLDERITYALNQHYSNLAYLLFSQNYLTANPTEKSKMDAARVALEAKAAGLAGKGDALTRFFDDLHTGKLMLKPAMQARLQ